MLSQLVQRDNYNLKVVTSVFSVYSLKTGNESVALIGDKKVFFSFLLFFFLVIVSLISRHKNIACS